jgi:hypothetical protein
MAIAKLNRQEDYHLMTNVEGVLDKEKKFIED